MQWHKGHDQRQRNPTLPCEGGYRAEPKRLESSYERVVSRKTNIPSLTSSIAVIEIRKRRIRGCTSPARLVVFLFTSAGAKAR